MPHYKETGWYCPMCKRCDRSIEDHYKHLEHCIEKLVDKAING